MIYLKQKIGLTIGILSNIYSVYLLFKLPGYMIPIIITLYTITVAIIVGFATLLLEKYGYLTLTK